MFMNKSKLAAAVMCGLLSMSMLMTGCGGGAKKDAGNTIKIGVVSELTGPNASYGTSVVKGMKLAVKEINDKGGVDGKKIETPPKEMELLYHLASSPNRVFTRNQLLDEVWGFDYFGDSRTVDVHIKRLREKIENVSDQWELKTVWGVGYKFEVK